MFRPNSEIFETVDFSFETLRQRFQQMTFLNKGLTITLKDERPTATEEQATGATYLYTQGLVDYVQYMNSAKKKAIDNRLADAHVSPIWYPDEEHEHVEQILALLLD
jgi:DNA gyrase subunit B